MAISPCSSAVDEKGRELVVHGTVLFPIAIYDDDLLNNPVPWHWHEELEAGYITEGEIEVAVGSEKRILKPGDGFFVNTEVLHGAWASCSSSCRLESIVFHPRLVGGGLDSIFWQKYMEPLLTHPTLKCIVFDSSAPWHQTAIDAIETAWQSCYKEEPGYEFTIRAALSQLIYLLCSNLSATQTAPSPQSLRNAERIKTMLQYIHDHYADEITLTQISKHAMVSESECLRCFQKNIGTSPIQYVKQYRIQKAAALLR